jgi:hypothetical protein
VSGPRIIIIIIIITIITARIPLIADPLGHCRHSSTTIIIIMIIIITIIIFITTIIIFITIIIIITTIITTTIITTNIIIIIIIITQSLHCKSLYIIIQPSSRAPTVRPLFDPTHARTIIIIITTSREPVKTYANPLESSRLLPPAAI